MILTTNDQPQAAIVSIEDLEELKKAKALQANLDMLKFIGKYLSSLRKLDHVIAPKEGFETQL